ncbi:MAG: amino acid synthesis family protein [Gammaproteobacteria bacterium]|nr:amino acid synthesis family protein [Gammaproteobacteria bacterium]
MAVKIRKLVKYIDETRIEGGRPADRPLELMAVAAVIPNPWAGQEFVENLRPQILSVAPALADVMVPELVKLAGSGDRVEAYGKAAVVGMHGEVEHASAMIHTLRFGNKFREAVAGTSFLSFTNKRGSPGCTISIPMVHKTDDGLRSHFLTLEFTVSDAPGADEILVAIGAATGGRMHPRIGDRYQDMQEMNNEG